MPPAAPESSAFPSTTNFNGDCDITGGDVSDELLAKAKQETADKGYDIQFIPLNFNERFPFEDNTFDLLSCCFAIYYSEDIPFTIREMHRVLKPGGRLFTDGPMPQNKQVFYDIIREATTTRSSRPCPAAHATTAKSWAPCAIPSARWT